MLEDERAIGDSLFSIYQNLQKEVLQKPKPENSVKQKPQSIKPKLQNVKPKPQNVKPKPQSIKPAPLKNKKPKKKPKKKNGKKNKHEKTVEKQFENADAIDDLEEIETETIVKTTPVATMAPLATTKSGMLYVLESLC